MKNIVLKSMIASFVFTLGVVIFAKVFAIIQLAWSSPDSLEMTGGNVLTANSRNKLLSNFKYLKNDVDTLNSKTYVGFGGMYQTSNAGCNIVNPKTNSLSCPTGFTDTVVYLVTSSNHCSGINDQIYLHLCWK